MERAYAWRIIDLRKDLLWYSPILWVQLEEVLDLLEQFNNTRLEQGGDKRRYLLKNKNYAIVGGYDVHREGYDFEIMTRSRGDMSAILQALIGYCRVEISIVDQDGQKHTLTWPRPTFGMVTMARIDIGSILVENLFSR